MDFRHLIDIDELVCDICHTEIVSMEESKFLGAVAYYFDKRIV